MCRGVVYLLCEIGGSVEDQGFACLVILNSGQIKHGSLQAFVRLSETLAVEGSGLIQGEGALPVHLNLKIHECSPEHE